MVIGDILVTNSQRFPHKLGLADKDTRLTWAETNQKVNQIANAMLALGLKKGDRVAILAVIDDCSPRAIVVQDKYAETINSIRSQMGSVEFIIGLGKNHSYPYDFELLQAGQSSDEPAVEVGEQDIFTILYTSGTTGTPKAGCITHNNRVTACLTLSTIYRCSSTDVAIMGPALFANGGQTVLFTYSVMGMGIVIAPFAGKVPVRYQVFRDYLDTATRKYDLSSITKIPIGSAQPCPYEKLKEILDYFGVSYSFPTYGMTETTGVVTSLVPEEVATGMRPDATPKERKRIDSVGKPLLGVQLRVVDDNDNDVSAGQAGEILIKGDTVMSGYWNKPELSKKVLRGGWYHTSDLGMLDEDGYLYYVGRKDFQIHSGGFFVTPAEVEEIVLQHPAVSEVAVIGIPSERWGEEVTAVVVLKEGQITSEEEIRDLCRRSLARFQVPKNVHFRTDLPKHPDYGRVQVRELRRIYGEGKT